MSKSKIVRKLFECTTRGSSDTRNPIAVVMEELNNTVPADRVISIDERSGVGHFVSDENEIGGGYFPRFAKLLVFFWEDVDEEEKN